MSDATLEDPARRPVGWYIMYWKGSEEVVLAGPFSTQDQLAHAITREKIRHWDGKKWNSDA